ncbi:polyphosphoinositide phosphatase isoform X2 [Hydra vulgaris]|uniref:Polyphosphoinositide phosphatase isoform X2 n=1 Tax=Hydra vulgaris TaxID=6087 RepID=A0ABM4BGV4_HYDVU
MLSYDVVHPICCTQKIAVYETKSRFYLVGSNNSQSRFRVLKIDRTEPTEINVIDDKVEYNEKEISELLKRIDVGNRPKTNKSYEKGTSGLTLRCSAFGILGLIRFLEGYYLILIAKRRRVALIGGHAIYKIDDTAIIPIANEQAKSKMTNPDEQKYLRIFQNVDLASNFYFSYSYDVTRSLQYNLAPYYGLPKKFCDYAEEADMSKLSDEYQQDNNEDVTEDAKDLNFDQIYNFSSKMFKEGMELPSVSANIIPDMSSLKNSKKKKQFKTKVFRGIPTEKFVWNSYILKELKDNVHPDWLLNIIHGFVGQSNISVYGKPLYITLIARRSNKFAGTRFLKRGSNDEGFVANDVETEQICHDASTISLRSGHYTSYVQLRGSVPSFWSQDTTGGRITPKPQILVDRADPYFTVSASHFNSLMSRSGAPLIILNLVKIKEKKAHEQILSGLLKESIDYLNQFLPPEHFIQYIPWDMARVTKSKEDKVIEVLAKIAEKVMKETGFFHSGPQIYCNDLRKHPSFLGMKGFGYTDEHPGLRQTGILRVNCVDCLDRTNTAQFMVGKCALGFQLYALGVVESPILQFDSDAVRIFEELFEAHGDTLALQYGGSQMVHRIRTYRKIAAWTSYSRDIMQTVSRYYSNAFTDTDKQQAINLFLGTYTPNEKLPNIWDMVTDYYLHHNSTTNLDNFTVRPSYTKWWQDEVVNSLPFAWDEVAKSYIIENDENIFCEDEEILDLFAEYYRPSELTELDHLYAKTMPTSTKDFMPPNCTDPSPFVVRARGKTQNESQQVSHRNVIGGQPLSPNETSEEDSSSDEDKAVQFPLKLVPRDPLITDIGDSWSVSVNVYGINIMEPSGKDLELYKRFAEVSNITCCATSGNKRSYKGNVEWECTSKFSTDSTLNVTPPKVEDLSKDFYNAYCQIEISGPLQPTFSDAVMYSSYISQKYL